MIGYTQLCSSIVTSTIWREDLATKVVWITLLALSDSEGAVEGSIPGLAHIAGVSVEDCERSLSTLQQPDKYSRTPDHEGRRIEAIDGGWFILNRAKYRDKNWREGKAARHREANRRYYDRKKNSDTFNPKLSESDRVGDKTDTDTDTKSKSKRGSANGTATCSADGTAKRSNAVALPAWLPTEPWAGFVEMRKKIRKPLTDRAIALIVTKLQALQNDGHDPGAVLDQSTRNDWQDVYALKADHGNGNGSRRPSDGLVFESTIQEDPGACSTCGGEKKVRRRIDGPGPRTAPCPDCSPQNASTGAASQ